MHMNLEEWIDRYGDEILRLCLAYLGDRQLAEDAFQETFLKAWKARETFRKESSEKTWLSHIVVNTCRDFSCTAAEAGHDRQRQQHLLWRSNHPNRNTGTGGTARRLYPARLQLLGESTL